MSPHRTTSPRIARAVTAAGAVGLLTAALLATAPAASASTVVAECTSTSTDTVSPALDPGVGNDSPEAVTYRGTGTIKCLDLGGKPLAQGTVVFHGSIAAAECTDNETSGSYTGTVTWSDGTQTTGTYTTFKQLNIDGTGTLTISGTTNATSTKFPGYAVSITGISSGTGCGTASGETAKSATTNTTFSKL